MTSDSSIAARPATRSILRSPTPRSGPTRSRQSPPCSSKLGIAEEEAAQAWTLALIVGLVFTVPTALTGFADWLQIARRTPLWRTATAHMIAMLIAAAFFLVAIGAGYADGMDGVLTDGAFVSR